MSDRTWETGTSACSHGHLYIGGVSAARILLWLAAIGIVSFAIGFGILALSGGFSPGQDLSPFRHTALLTPGTTTVPLDGATAADVKLTLGAGDLLVRGGAPGTALAEATVFSGAPEWRPDMVQGINDSRKSLSITEKGHRGKEWFAMDSPNRWEISLAEAVPIRLDANVGAGNNRLDLGSLSLESLDVHTGAGDTTIDLGGYHGGRFDAAIRNGIGDLTLRVPRGSNTRIRVSSGIGDIMNKGFVQEGDTYLTPAFNASLAINEITLNQGVGSISLETA